MPVPTTEQFSERFAIGTTLDHLWSETMGLPIDDKETVLAKLIKVLDDTITPYAVMGGIAVQLYTEEPRTTTDVDIALHTREDIPRKGLEEAGFDFDGIYEWSENWRGPTSKKIPWRRRVAVQFSADELMAKSVDRALTEKVGKFQLQLVTISDLILLKLAAASEPKRRASKRSQDITDVLRLLEEHPELNSSRLRSKVSLIQRTLLGLR